MDVLILAGGEARRLHGVDKPTVEVGGKSLLDRVIEACVTAVHSAGGVGAGGIGTGAVSAGEVVVVGPSRVTQRAVRWVQEEPPGGGPVAAIAAGLAALSNTKVEDRVNAWVGVFAADLPFLTAETVHSLWTAAVGSEPGTDGAVAVDAGGRDQWLAAVYRQDALTSKLAEYGEGAAHGIPMRRLVHDLRLLRVAQPAETVLDCDTWDDVATARRIADRGPRPAARAQTEEGI